MHPAHVPLHVEAQPAEIDGTRDHRPGRRLLRERDEPRIFLMDQLVELLEEIHGLEILAAAELVGNPLARLARVVQIEHGGHRIHAQAVDVVDIGQEDRVGEQEGAHFVAAVVEDIGAPVLVLALARIVVLVEMRAVEIGQPVAVLREMRRHPVDDHADALLVAAVHEVLEVVRRAEAGRRRIVADGLVAPGPVERMLADRQQSRCACSPSS